MSKSNNEALAGCLAHLALFAACLTVLPAWRGYVLATVWGWLIVPTFGLPALTTWKAVGLVIVAGFFATFQRNPKSPDQSSIEQSLEVALYYFLQPLFALLGAVVIRGWL